MFKAVTAIFVLCLFGLFFLNVEPANAQTGQLIGEAGTIGPVSQASKTTWQRFRFRNRYTNPVVVAQGLTFNDAAPTTVRLNNLTQTYFDYQIDEWDYLDGVHGNERINFIVFEAGTHTLADGRKVVAGFTNASSTAVTVPYGSSFSATPTVFTQIVSINDAKAGVTRHKNINTNSFQVFLQGQERNPSHGSERIAFVAIERGIGKTNGKIYSARNTSDVVTHNFFSTGLGTTFPAAPVFIAAMQKADDLNPATMRYRNLTRTSVQFKIEEEKSKDTEVTHATEPVGYFAIPAGSILTGSIEELHPRITSTTPAGGSTNVRRDVFVAANVFLPNEGQGINSLTLTSSTVKLYPMGNPGAQVPATLNTSGGGDVIVLQPNSLLAANTSYVFEVTAGVEDMSGASFQPYTMNFRTGDLPANTVSDIQFEKVQLTNTAGKHTTVTIGPDGKLYATTMNGVIKRWTINPDGTLGTVQAIGALRNAEGGDRLVVGFTFDPQSTANNLVVWVAHATFGFNNMPDWGSKLTKMSGPNLGQIQDYLVDLPRSFRDHVTNSIAFGPDGKMYIAQGSSSAMGAPDNTWGNRSEHLLTGAILRVDINALDAMGNNLPLNVKTEEGGTYNPYAPGAPVKLFATGTRNSYDLVWHTNGYLYVPTNGSAENGKAPASVIGTLRPDGTTYNGPSVPAIDLVEAQPDYLFKIPPPVNGTWQYRYYGHPNPRRGEFAMNGGNPTSGTDPGQVNKYPVGVQPDVKWQGFAYNFGVSISADGVIEYKNASAFNGALRGKLLVTRYSGGDDIVVLTPDPTTGNIPSDGDLIGLTGLTQFADPLDLTENPANGYIYVSEFATPGKITLLKPISAQAKLAGAMDSTATVQDFLSTDTPEEYKLYDNYPNPFNPQTTFKYDLPEQARVTFEVYDMMGRRIALLVNEIQEAGTYTITYDAGHLASGQYLYRMHAGQYAKTGLMVLVK